MEAAACRKPACTIFARLCATEKAGPWGWPCPPSANAQRALFVAASLVSVLVQFGASDLLFIHEGCKHRLTTLLLSRAWAPLRGYDTEACTTKHQNRSGAPTTWPCKVVSVLESVRSAIWRSLAQLRANSESPNPRGFQPVAILRSLVQENQVGFEGREDHRTLFASVGDYRGEVPVVQCLASGLARLAPCGSNTWGWHTRRE